MFGVLETIKACSARAAQDPWPARADRQRRGLHLDAELVAVLDEQIRRPRAGAGPRAGASAARRRSDADLAGLHRERDPPSRQSWRVPPGREGPAARLARHARGRRGQEDRVGGVSAPARSDHHGARQGCWSPSSGSRRGCCGSPPAAASGAEPSRSARLWRACGYVRSTRSRLRCCSSASCRAAAAAELTVFVTGSMVDPLEHVAEDFTQATGHTLRFERATTGGLLAQDPRRRARRPHRDHSGGRRHAGAGRYARRRHTYADRKLDVRRGRARRQRCTRRRNGRRVPTDRAARGRDLVIPIPSRRRSRAATSRVCSASSASRTRRAPKRH